MSGAWREAARVQCEQWGRLRTEVCVEKSQVDIAAADDTYDLRARAFSGACIAFSGVMRSSTDDE